MNVYEDALLDVVSGAKGFVDGEVMCMTPWTTHALGLVAGKVERVVV
jgi:hypothetical protein